MQKISLPINLYYCYCPNGKTEGIIGVPKLIDDSPVHLQGYLHEVNRNFGELLSDTLSLVMPLLSDTEGKYGQHNITEALFCKHLGSNDNLHGDLLHPFLRSVLCETVDNPIASDILACSTNQYSDFIADCIKDEAQCTIDSLRTFSREKSERMVGAETVQLNLEDYFNLRHSMGALNFEELTDVLLSHFQLSQKERVEIINRLPLYTDNADEFWMTLRKELSDLLMLYPKDSPILTYHIYKLDFLSDLLSASLQEIFNEKKIIKRCGNCNKLFVPPKRSDTQYCLRPSPGNPEHTCAEEAKYQLQVRREKSKILNESYRKKYNVIKTMLLTKYGETSDKYNLFLSENAVNKQNVLDGLLSEEEYVAWLMSYTPNKKNEKPGI